MQYKLNTPNPGVLRLNDDGTITWIPRIVGVGAYDAYLAAGGDAIALAADPPTLIFNDAQSLHARISTADANATTIITVPLLALSGYGAYVDIYALDRANGVMKSWLFKALVKRLAGGALAIGKQDLHPAIQEPAGAPATASSVATWDYATSVSGNNALVSVTGAVGRTVDWFAYVSVRRFTPQGA